MQPLVSLSTSLAPIKGVSETPSKCRRAAGSRHSDGLYIFKRRPCNALLYLTALRREPRRAVVKANPGTGSGDAAAASRIAVSIQLISKPPETNYFPRRWRRPATWGFTNGLQAACVDSLAIAAGGLRATGRLSFKTHLFGAIDPQKTAARALWDKFGNSSLRV